MLVFSGLGLGVSGLGLWCLNVKGLGLLLEHDSHYIQNLLSIEGP